MKTPDDLLPSLPGLPEPDAIPPVTAEVDGEWTRKFEADLAADIAFERSIPWRELWIIAAIVLFVVLREVLL